MAQKAKKTKKQRKFGRNAAFCLRYRNSRRREHNKLRRLKKHLARFPGDAIALKAVDLCKVVIRSY
jgi:hypothetical protein